VAPAKEPVAAPRLDAISPLIWICQEESPGGVPLTPYDRSTFYAFDARGYTDFRDYDAEEPFERRTG
jgi:hypothetical protein